MKPCKQRRVQGDARLVNIWLPICLHAELSLETEGTLA